MSRHDPFAALRKRFEAAPVEEHDSFQRAHALAAEAEVRGVDLLTYIAEHAPELLRETGRGASAAKVLIDTCKAYGIGLTVREGDLVIQSRGRAWASLVRALEAHAAEIIAILRGEK